MQYGHNPEAHEVREPKTREEQLAYDEPHRPRFHFTPPRGWVNDPNGLVYLDGEYHLFYQYFPDDTVWGPMHWGHAVSQDLVNWQHLPIALYPDNLGYIFSGSAVIDRDNTAGFGRDALVAIFTHHAHDTHTQSQSIAYSTDNGRSWTKYPGNPLITPPDGLRDFRDPKVFWYDDPGGGGHWVMALATTAAVLFYTSPDLVHWQPSGRFGDGPGSTGGVWECPDLVQLSVDGGPDKRWVLILGVGNAAPAGGSGEQYFIGHFDGRTFHNDNPETLVLWFDYGADNYATQTWSGAPDGRCLALSWMNNWSYGRHLPTTPWRGAMTLPRELSLSRTADGLRLRQRAPTEFTQLRRTTWQQTAVGLSPDQPLKLPTNSRRLEIILDATIAADQGGAFGLNLRGPGDAQTTMTYIPSQERLTLDRVRSGAVDFHDTFPSVHSAPLPVVSGELRLHIVIDHASIELFASDGLLTMTDCIFPGAGPQSVELFAQDTAVHFSNITLHELGSARFTL